MRLHAKADKQIISIRNEARYRGRSPPVTSSQRDGASKRINRPIPRPAYAPTIKRENTRKSDAPFQFNISAGFLFYPSFPSFFLHVSRNRYRSLWMKKKLRNFEDVFWPPLNAQVDPVRLEGRWRRERERDFLLYHLNFVASKPSRKFRVC